MKLRQYMFEYKNNGNILMKEFIVTDEYTFTLYNNLKQLPLGLLVPLLHLSVYFQPFAV